MNKPPHPETSPVIALRSGGVVVLPRRPWKCKHCDQRSRTMWGMQMHQTMRHLDPLGYMADFAAPDDRQHNVEISHGGTPANKTLL